MKQLVIFDLDGTLINSIKDLGAATNFALEKNGFPTHPLEAYPMYVGNGVSKLIERALPEDQRNEAMIKKIRADFTTYYDIHNTDYTHPTTAFPSCLSTCRKTASKSPLRPTNMTLRQRLWSPRCFPRSASQP